MSLTEVRFQLGVGVPPDVDHELVGVLCLLMLAQFLRNAALLQPAEDEERALAAASKRASMSFS